jgi:hypothetical protein
MSTRKNTRKAMIRIAMETSRRKGMAKRISSPDDPGSYCQELLADVN